MSDSSFKKLAASARNSALSKSVVPVLLCSSDLTVCSVSRGVTKASAYPKIKGSLVENLSDNVLAGFLDPETDFILDSLCVNSKQTQVMITRGTIDDVDYYAVVCCPDKWFGVSKHSGVSISVCREICRSVRGLLERTADSAGNSLSTRLSMMYEYLSFAHGDADSPEIGETSVCQAIVKVCEFALPYIETVGGMIDIDFDDCCAVASSCSRSVFYPLVSSMLVSAVLVSKNSRVAVSCEMEGAATDKLTVLFSVECHKSVSLAIGSFEEFVEAVLPLSPELAAITAISAEAGAGLGCVSDGKKLKLTLTLPVEPPSGVTVNSPLGEYSCEQLDKILHSLFGIIGISVKQQ